MIRGCHKAVELSKAGKGYVSALLHMGRGKGPAEGKISGSLSKADIFLWYSYWMAHIAYKQAGSRYERKKYRSPAANFYCIEFDLLLMPESAEQLGPLSMSRS